MNSVESLYTVFLLFFFFSELALNQWLLQLVSMNLPIPQLEDKLSSSEVIDRLPTRTTSIMHRLDI